MRVIRSVSGTEVLAPAKLNLFLEIQARRDDGFHEIQSLMVPIAWHDRLVVSPISSAEIRFQCRTSRRLSAAGFGAAEVPTDASNLAVRAARLLQQRAGVGSGLAIQLEKRIPPAAGLGGGSSDAAATLAAASVAWNLDWSVERLAELAAELGSDVPFFLLSRPALARGRGERLERVAGLGQLSFVVVRPPEGLSTAAVYRACAPSTAPRGVGALIDALRARRYGELSGALHNGLQTAAASLSPWIDRMRDEFARVDVAAHAMSGSGTSYFGVCRHARHARRVAAQLSGRGLGIIEAVESCS